MLIRNTTARDMDRVLEIIASARAYFKAAGIPQWQGEYPSREIIERDIAAGESYVCEHDGNVCAFCAIVGGAEPDYERIYEGEWKNQDEYISLHRVAVTPECKGIGVGAAFVGKAIEIAASRGISNIKCDTHRINTNMRRMLEKNGFELCGIIYLTEDGAERVAYQKQIEVKGER